MCVYNLLVAGLHGFCFYDILRKDFVRNIMKIGKIFSRIFGNKSRVIIAGECPKYPLREGRAITQEEVPFFLK